MASTGVKIALIGCTVVLVAAAIVVGVGGYFVKKKVSEKLDTLKNVSGTEDSEYGKKTAQLSKSYPFTPPSNGTITEEQLRRFLAVRKEVYGVYKKYEPEFNKLSQDGQQAFSGAMKGLSMWNEIRMSQAKALETQRMSSEEYTYIVGAVYKTWFARGAKEALKQETLTKASEETLRKSILDIDQRLRAPDVPEQERKVLEQTKATLESQLNSLSENTQLKQLDAELQSVPKENIELFNKYRSEIEQYSMSGLEFIGL